MITIEEFDYAQMKGKTYSAKVYSDTYLSIEPQGNAFLFEWKKSEQEIVIPLQD